MVYPREEQFKQNHVEHEHLKSDIRKSLKVTMVVQIVLSLTQKLENQDSFSV